MTESWQIRWTKGFMPFDACDYGTILAKGKGRKHTKSGGHTYWCVIKDGQWISIYNVKMAQKLMTVVYEFKTSNIKIDKSKFTDKPVCISRKDGLQNNNYIYTLVTLDMENDFPIALTYNAIAGDEENWNKPITQTTLVKNCKAF